MTKEIKGLFESHFKVDESSSEVDGKFIIGKISGQFFVPNGKSRNERFYPSELWERALAAESVQEKIRDRRMFGTISHDQKIDDAAFLEGKFSHIVTKLNPKTGVGEALILNTPAGNILNTVVRAGSKIFVSSRARGDFAGTHKGLPRVNPDTYCLETFDIVLSPGFLEASPSLQESYKSARSFNEIREHIKRGTGMKKKHISTSNSPQSAGQVSESADLYESELLERYKALGTPEELEEVMSIAEDKLVESSTKKIEEDILHEELGTPEEISEVFSVLEEFIDRNGSLQEVEEANQQALEFFEELGSPAEISTALDLAERAVRKATAIIESQEYYYDEYEDDFDEYDVEEEFEDDPFDESLEKYRKKEPIRESREIKERKPSPFEKSSLMHLMEKFSK